MIAARAARRDKHLPVIGCQKRCRESTSGTLASRQAGFGSTLGHHLVLIDGRAVMGELCGWRGGPEAAGVRTQ
jgi:hypothetical protein